MKLQNGDYIKLEGVSDETLKEVRDAFVRSGDVIAYRICDQELSPEDAQAEDEEFARIAKESIVTKQERYLQEDGKDLIDRWAERYNARDFRMIMFAVMERYQERIGKKDHPAVECRKIADYANRLALVEEGRN